MTKRITIMIDEENYAKVQKYQMKVMKETEASYSFSKALNDILGEN